MNGRGYGSSCCRNEAVQDTWHAQACRPQHQSGHGAYFGTTNLCQNVNAVSRIWLVQLKSLAYQPAFLLHKIRPDARSLVDYVFKACVRKDSRYG